MSESPMPLDHVRLLRTQVDAHAERVDELREAIGLAEQEIALHEAIDCLSDHAERLVAAMSGPDPTGPTSIALQAARASLPAGATLRLSPPTEARGPLTGELTCGNWVVAVGWDLARGFFARPDTRFVKVRQIRIAHVDLSLRATGVSVCGTDNSSKDGGEAP